MIDLRSSIRKLGRALHALWRTRMGKLTAVLILLSAWAPVVLCIPGIYYGIRLVRSGMRRLLWSVRAKLAAFYLYAALLPIVLAAVVLLFVLYVVFGQVSARVVESRLERQIEWSEQQAERLEETYWQSRSQGRDPQAAVVAAIDSAFDRRLLPELAAWALDEHGRLVVVRGRPRPGDLAVPAWLGERRFVGIAAEDSNRLVLRTRSLVVDGATRFDVGSVLPIDGRVLNRGLDGDRQTVHGSLGTAGRGLQECEALADSTLRERGIVAYLMREGDDVTVAPTQVTIQDAHRRQADSTRSGWTVRLDAGREGRGSTWQADSAFAEIPGLALDSLRLRSRYPLLYWAYVGHPVDWRTGSTQDGGPPILTTFSVEGAGRELLRTGVGLSRPMLWLVATVVGTLMILLIVASLQGLTYARSISNSVAKLDRGVRAIRAGDFDYRVTPRERDQLGALAMAFNDMSGRLQGLLEERANMQAVERELAIARDVQARLFPERTPYAPFLEAAGVCVPARAVSGDYYDFIEVPSGFDSVVADVSGKGMSAALLMASLHAALHSLYLRDGHAEPPDIGEIVTDLNTHLNQYVEPTRFVTLFLTRYHGDGKLLYCNAGHNPAALVQDGRVGWLTSGGLMLGPFQGLRYEPAVVRVQPGDLVCIYTDGVTEAESPSGEQFGEERLAQVLREVAAAHPREAIAAVQQRVREWREEREPGDDLTLVALRVTQ